MRRDNDIYEALHSLQCTLADLVAGGNYTEWREAELTRSAALINRLGPCAAGGDHEDKEGEDACVKCGLYVEYRATAGDGGAQ